MTLESYSSSRPGILKVFHPSRFDSFTSSQHLSLLNRITLTLRESAQGSQFPLVWKIILPLKENIPIWLFYSLTTGPWPCINQTKKKNNQWLKVNILISLNCLRDCFSTKKRIPKWGMSLAIERASYHTSILTYSKTNFNIDHVFLEKYKTLFTIQCSNSGNWKEYRSAILNNLAKMQCELIKTSEIAVVGHLTRTGFTEWSWQ